MPVRILVVDDDRAVRESLRRSLTFNGYSVELAQDGVEALERISSDRPDAVVLDDMMPRLDGRGVCRQLRSSGDDLPVLMLTARDSIDERVAGLDAGADDYLTKPFHLEELAARIRSLTRRTQGLAANRIEAGALSLDLGTSEVVFRGQRVELTKREFALLQILMERAGRLVRRETLENSLYGLDNVVGSSALEVLMHTLRRKLSFDTIQTVRGFGYMIAREPK